MTSTTEAVAPASATVRDITARFHHLATTQPDRVAVIDRHRSTTFADLWRLAYQDAAHRPADQTVVPVVARPDAATIAAAMGVWLTGGIPLPVPAGARLKTLTAAAQQATSVAHTCRPWRASLHAEPGARHVYVTGGVPPTDPRLGDAIGLTGGGTALITAPLYAAAIFEAAVRQLLAGGTIVLRHEFEPDDWLATAVETGADWAVLAAEQLIALIRRQEAVDGWLPVATRALRRVVVPAAVPALNAGYLAALTSQAGAAVAAWYHAPAYDGAISRPGGPPNVLTPLPGIHLRIVDPCGRPASPGVAGLIEASSSRGATCHRADLPCTPAGAWRTAGDIGTLDADGNLTLRRLDPARHYLDPAGARVTVAALRETLDAHPDITAHTVHVVPDDDGQRRVRVHVWTRTTLSADAVARHCARPRHRDTRGAHHRHRRPTRGASHGGGEVNTAHRSTSSTPGAGGRAFGMSRWNAAPSRTATAALVVSAGLLAAVLLPAMLLMIRHRTAEIPAQPASPSPAHASRPAGTPPTSPPAADSVPCGPDRRRLCDSPPRAVLSAPVRTSRTGASNAWPDTRPAGGGIS